MATLVSGGPAEGLTLPKIQVKKTLDRTSVGVGDYATVTIVVAGDAQVQTQPVATAVVIAIDESGSMATGNAFQKSREAAKAAIQSLRAGIDKASLITFSSSASVNVPLTSNLTSVVAAINSLGSPSGGTNFKQTFDLANSAFGTDPSPNRIVILFTDGIPNDLGDINYITNQIDIPKKSGIKYFTVGYGPNVLTPFLKSLAEDTGGTAFFTTDPADFTSIFKNILQSEKDTLYTRNVVVQETVSSDFTIRPGSLNTSHTGVVNAPAFQTALKALEQQFYSTNSITFPQIYLLGKSRNFTFFFEVSPKTCTEKIRTLGVDDLTSSQISFDIGVPQTQPKPVQINQATLEVAACGVCITKEYDSTSGTVTITLRNTWPDPIQDIVVRDLVSRWVLARIDSASPPAKRYDAPGNPPAEVAIALPETPRRVPLTPANLRIRGLEWKQASLASGASQSFSFGVEFAPNQTARPGEYPINALQTTAVLSYVSYRVNTVIISASPGQAILIKIRQALDAGHVGPDLAKTFNDAGHSLADSAARSKPISPGSSWQITSTRGSYDVEIQGDVLTVRTDSRKTIDMPPLTNGTSGYSCSN